MTIEEKIFKNTKINFSKLLTYGFRLKGQIYEYSKNIMLNKFRIIIYIDTLENINGKIYDVLTNEEYEKFRIENLIGEYSLQVKEEFIKLLEDIKDKCCDQQLFECSQTNQIVKLIKTEYHNDPIFEWEKFPRYAVFKNSRTKKWYGIIMNINKDKLENNATGEVEIINLKLEPKKIEELLQQKGYYKAYHMNKKNWITILLNDTISNNKLMELIHESYLYSCKK